MENKVKKDEDIEQDAEKEIVDFIQKSMGIKSHGRGDIKEEIVKFFSHLIKNKENGEEEEEEHSSEELNEFEIIKMFLLKKMETVL